MTIDTPPPPPPPPPPSAAAPTSMNEDALIPAPATPAKRQPVKRFIHKANRIPDDILENPALKQALSFLPSNYNFEIPKTIWRLRQANATCVALQFPEGLLMYACTISDILQTFVPHIKHVVIMGDVTYGACCIDDLSALAVGADFLVHYGHSCLVPVTCTTMKALYVFVEIGVDVRDLVRSLRVNLGGSEGEEGEKEEGEKEEVEKQQPESRHTVQLHSAAFSSSSSFSSSVPTQEEPAAATTTTTTTDPPATPTPTPSHPPKQPQKTRPKRNLCLMGTIQFVSAIHEASLALQPHFSSITIPQAKPLSAGEVLGCTAPVLNRESVDVLVFVADGRFHLEAAMIANPELEAYRYNPYDKTLTREYYETQKMLSLRKGAVEKGKKAKRWGVVLGTLGRQGNPSIVEHALSLLEGKGCEAFVLLLSEITPQKLALMQGEVDAWVQVACPRLSIDWGHFFQTPVLTAYELEVAMGEVEWKEDRYPMDYYSKNAGPWGNVHPSHVKRKMLGGVGGGGVRV